MTTQTLRKILTRSFILAFFAQFAMVIHFLSSYPYPPHLSFEIRIK